MDCDTSTCKALVVAGGAECSDCMSCGNCDGGECLNGRCVCFGGYTCPHCEGMVLEVVSGAYECDADFGASSSLIRAAEIFGMIFGGFVGLVLLYLCARGYLRDSKTNALPHLQFSRAIRAKIEKKFDGNERLSGIELMRARQSLKAKQQQEASMQYM